MTDPLLEFQGKGRSRGIGALRQFLQARAMRRIVVDRANRLTHLGIYQGEEPADAMVRSFRQIEPEGLYQDQLGKMLCDQEAARLLLELFLHHSLERPPQACSVGFLAKMNNRRQDTQQDIRMIPGKINVLSYNNSSS